MRGSRWRAGWRGDGVWLVLGVVRDGRAGVYGVSCAGVAGGLVRRGSVSPRFPVPGSESCVAVLFYEEQGTKVYSRLYSSVDLECDCSLDRRVIDDSLLLFVGPEIFFSGVTLAGVLADANPSRGVDNREQSRRL